MRDLLADHFLETLGYIPRRDKPPCEIWFFHSLYAGGVLEEQSKAMDKINGELGKHGSIRTDGLRKLRDMIPAMSLLGTALGNKIIPGRINVGDLRPFCKEWGFPEGPKAANLMDWEYLTRREDYEGRGEEDAHTGMIAMSEVLKTGTMMHGGIDIDTHANDLERSCLGMGLKLLIEKGKLGAENRRGFGKVGFVVNNIPDHMLYEKYLEENKDSLKKYLYDIDAVTEPFIPKGAIDASGQLDCFGDLDKF
jgi:hypothetical protein